MAKKILVTGVAGFIGSNLADRLLAAAYDVIGIDNLAYGKKEQIPAGVDFRKLDVRSKDIYPAFEGVEAVFHLAAKNDLIACQNDPVETMDINVHGTANVFEAAKRAGVKKVIFASSSALEEGGARLKGFYAISKIACEKIAEGYRAAWGVDYVLPRYFNVYGPRQDYRRLPNPPVMTAFILKAFKGEPPVFYEGYERDGRDFIYVDDLSDFHLMCLTNDAVNNKIFRLGTGKSSSIKEVWETIEKVMGVSIEPTIKPGPEGHVPVMTNADTKDAEAVGWHAKTSLEDGLRTQIAFLKAEMEKGNIK
ncbi:MAG TPA: NAD-dependent epimerase/dehydratase family protein [Candidatus Paceibacterota bacterium]